jgi:hypothetical protein
MSQFCDDDSGVRLKDGTAEALASFSESAPSYVGDVEASARPLGPTPPQKRPHKPPRNLSARVLAGSREKPADPFPTAIRCFLPKRDVAVLLAAFAEVDAAKAVLH